MLSQIVYALLCRHDSHKGHGVNKIKSNDFLKRDLVSYQPDTQVYNPFAKDVREVIK